MLGTAACSTGDENDRMNSSSQYFSLTSVRVKPLKPSRDRRSHSQNVAKDSGTPVTPPWFTIVIVMFFHHDKKSPKKLLARREKKWKASTSSYRLSDGGAATPSRRRYCWPSRPLPPASPSAAQAASASGSCAPASPEPPHLHAQTHRDFVYIYNQQFRAPIRC